MISTVLSVLSDLGALQPGHQARYNISLTKGDALLLNVFVDNQSSFFHIRISENISLGSEFQNHQTASYMFTEFVPRPLGYFTRDGWEIVVTEGVHYRYLSPKLAISSPVRQGIFKFFATATLKARIERPAEPHSVFLTKLHQHFKGSPFVSLLESWLTTSGRNVIDALAHIRQHGDFVPINLGIAKSKVVVFDWEDFGKIMLPGFDLCTLFISMVQFDAHKILLLMETDKPGSDPYISFMQEACLALDLDFQLFCRLIPVYILISSYLKENYAAPVRQSTEMLLRQLLIRDDHTIGPSNPIACASKQTGI